MDFRINQDLCVACLACVRVCPADAVAVDGERGGAGVWIVDDACTRCGLCLPACPHEAIRATGDLARAQELARDGNAILILTVESAAYFYPSAPEQVVNAAYAAGFRIVHRGVIGDELIAREYARMWEDEGWGTMIRSTCPVIVETVRTKYPELVPYLAPVTTPIAAEARYLKQMYGPDTPVVYAGVCLTEGREEVDAAITFAELATLFSKQDVRVEDQPTYFSRIPEERRRHWSTAGGLPLEILMEERHSSRRFRKLRGMGHLEQLARAVAVDRIELGFVDILPCEGCLDHPLLGPKEELFWRREIVGASEPARSRTPIVDSGLAGLVQIGEAFPFDTSGTDVADDAVDQILTQIGLAPNGRAWDCGACGYRTCRSFAAAAARGRTTLKSCPPYLEKEKRQAQLQAAVDSLTGLATFRVLRDRLASEMARSARTADSFAVLFIDLDNFKRVNDEYGHEAGNEVLRNAAKSFAAMIRSTDLAARYGGDEFVLVLVRTGLDGAHVVAEKIRTDVEALGRRLGYPEGLVTVSIGVAEVRPTSSEGPEQEDVLITADRALYRAKEQGRNRVALGVNGGGAL
ncbi:MAG TPA: diguanylate cyclase [Gemmatimonadales bacterium]|nr:diguanylate cyclase [Gemmatimonadales bacterium]